MPLQKTRDYQLLNYKFAVDLTFKREDMFNLNYARMANNRNNNIATFKTIWRMFYKSNMML